MISLLSKQDLSIINKRTLRYNLAVAEKDYFLALISKIIFDSPLREKLVFKGGTAIHHCYLPQYRFSEDLDFTSTDRNIDVQEVRDALESNDFIDIKKVYKSDSTIKLERVQYAGPLGLPNFMKIEIDFTQNVVLPARPVQYNNAWGVEASVMVMDISEICAEKIRACSDRARYRDFYDLFLIFDKFKPGFGEIVKLIEKKEIRKPISKDSIYKNWETVLEEKSGELAQIHYSRQVEDSALKLFIDSFPFKVIG